MKKVIVSAPGKLMLFGEHAVVYGRPCLVTAVSQRMRATIDLLDEPVFQLNAPDVHITNYQKAMSQVGKGGIPRGAKFVEIAVANFYSSSEAKRSREVQNDNSSRQARTIKSNQGIKVTTSSEFSSQFGFGSSSAVTVCVLKSLSELLGIHLSNKELFKLAYKTVLDVQKKGSGFDVAAAIYGGTLYFVKAGKIIEPLQINGLPLIVGYSGSKADTVTLMQQVSEKAKKDSKAIENIYSEIGRLVTLAKIALLEKDWETVGELMNKNQEYLNALGVGSPKLNAMIAASLSEGAFGAKLSGAGGGDCMIALCPVKNKQKIAKAIEKAGGEIINVQINAEGVKLET